MPFSVERELGGGASRTWVRRLGNFWDIPSRAGTCPGFWLDHVHEEDRDFVERFWQGEAASPGGSHTIEYRLKDSSRHDLVWVREFGHVSRGRRASLILQGS